MTSATWTRRRMIHSNLTVGTLLTRTDSTVSGIRGPGRTVGRVLSAGGRRLEPVLSRAAEFLGYGPNVIVRRLLPLIRHAHTLEPAHLEYLQSTGPDSLSVAPKDSMSEDPMNALVDVICHTCRQCRLSITSDFKPKGECSALLAKLLDYTRHNESSTRLLTIIYITLLALASQGLQQTLVRLGAVTMVEDTRTLAYQNPRDGWDAIIVPATLCLQMLQENPVLLSSIEPHRLDVDSPLALRTRFFDKYMQYTSYVSQPSVATGLRSLIDNIQTPGLLATLSMARLQAIFEHGMPVSTAYWSRNQPFVELLSQVLTAETVELWWALCPIFEAYQALLFQLYEGIGRWSASSWRSSSTRLKTHITDRIYMPFLAQLMQEMHPSKQEGTSRLASRPLSGWRMPWFSYIRNDLRDITDLDSGLARRVMEMVYRIEFTFLETGLSSRRTA